MEKTLICSSSELFRESTRKFLENKHNLILCEDISQCSEIIENTQIKLLLLDIENQENLSDYITKLISKSIKIIIVTNHHSIEKAEEIVKLGVSGYLVKPLTPEALLSCVK